ncbi:MAG: metalloregulator ArsR/SmtB family transcription factor [Gammaproteobacteria bacterium]
MQVISVKPPELFQALADPTRLRVIRLLAKTNAESCVCELSDSLAMPDYSLSRHLKVLRQVGLLTAVKEGRWIYHRVATQSPHVEQLAVFVCSLPDSDKQFARDLARFKKRMAARTNGRCRGSDSQSSVITQRGVRS